MGFGVDGGASFSTEPTGVDGSVEDASTEDAPRFCGSGAYGSGNWIGAADQPGIDPTGSDEPRGEGDVEGAEEGHDVPQSATGGESASIGAEDPTREDRVDAGVSDPRQGIDALAALDGGEQGCESQASAAGNEAVDRRAARLTLSVDEASVSVACALTVSDSFGGGLQVDGEGERCSVLVAGECSRPSGVDFGDKRRCLWYQNRVSLKRSDSHHQWFPKPVLA